MRESKRRLAEQVRALRAERAEPVEPPEPRTGVDTEALADHAARIGQLEATLAARAQEVEESDTRMLEVLRENKRLAAKVRALSQPQQRPVRAASKESPQADRGALTDRTNTPTRQRTAQKRAPETAFLDRLARFKAGP